MPVGLGARSAYPKAQRKAASTVAWRAGALGTDHAVFSSISMKANSKALALRTSCSTPASRK
jgi:hypothetical protein